MQILNPYILFYNIAEIHKNVKKKVFRRFLESDFLPSLNVHFKLTHIKYVCNVMYVPKYLQKEEKREGQKANNKKEKRNIEFSYYIPKGNYTIDDRWDNQ